MGCSEGKEWIVIGKKEGEKQEERQSFGSFSASHRSDGTHSDKFSL